MDEFDPLSKIKEVIKNTPKMEHVEIVGAEIDKSKLFPPDMLTAHSRHEMTKTLLMLEQMYSKALRSLLVETVSNNIIFKSPIDHIEYAHSISIQAIRTIIDKASSDGMH